MTGRLDRAIIDSSALVCIAMAEPAAPCFLDGFARTDKLVIGAATRAETWLAVHNAKGAAGARKIDALIETLDIEMVDFGADSLPHFRHGGAAYHHKFHPKARLNIGDLFTYALARQLRLPLFFQGTDFIHTDLANAMEILGYRMSASGVPQPGARQP